MKADQTTIGKLSEISTLELTKVEGTRTSLFFILSFLVSVMFLVAIFTTVKNGFSFFTLFPVFFTPVMVTNWLQMRAVKTEIKLRKSTNQ